jgi:cobalt-zinc-cadmium efflux system membrane fusion protein
MKRLMSVLAVLGVMGCHARADTSATQAAPSASAAPSPASHEIKVDPKLLEERIQVAVAERRALRGALVLTGQVVADEEGEGDAIALATGRVAALVVDDGARVKKGAILAWIDAPEVARMTAEVVRARTRAAQADRLLARQLELEAQQATSKNALDEARAGASGAHADLLAARTILLGVGGAEPMVASDTISGTRLAVRAPIEGVVVKRMTQVGSAVTLDKPLFHLVAPERVYVLAKLPETARHVVHEKELATVRRREAAGSEDEKGCAATVVRSFDVVDPDRTVPIRLAPTACTGMVVGRYVDVTFETHPAGAAGLVVPKEAAVEIKGARVVFVKRGPSAFEPRAVRLGQATATEVVVEDGLKDGDSVVVRGAVLLKGEVLRSELEAP